MENLLTKEQADRLREVLRGQHWEALMTLAFVTGMRRDELLGLRWQDIDLSKRELRVLNSKTKRDHRVIHCEDGMAELLTQHRLRQLQMQSEAGSARPHLDLVFASPLGGFLKPEQLLKEFDAILEQAESGFMICTRPAGRRCVLSYVESKKGRTARKSKSLILTRIAPHFSHKKRQRKKSQVLH